jgi:hypothetical protein
MNIYLASQRDSERIHSWGDILPVEANLNGKEAQSFVTVRAAKYTCEISGSRICETKDREACKHREHPFREDLPYKNTKTRSDRLTRALVENLRKKCNIEEFQSLSIAL